MEIDQASLIVPDGAEMRHTRLDVALMPLILFTVLQGQRQTISIIFFNYVTVTYMRLLIKYIYLGISMRPNLGRVAVGLPPTNPLL